jgi:hypothetical protein
MPNDHHLMLPDPGATARLDALEIMALAPARRAEALAELSDAYAAQAEVDGCSPVDAALFGLKMRRLVEAAMRENETGA